VWEVSDPFGLHWVLVDVAEEDKEQRVPARASRQTSSRTTIINDQSVHQNISPSFFEPYTISGSSESFPLVKHYPMPSILIAMHGHEPRLPVGSINTSGSGFCLYDR
jgi:hypothetical protein